MAERAVCVGIRDDVMQVVQRHDRVHDEPNHQKGILHAGLVVPGGHQRNEEVDHKGVRSDKEKQHERAFFQAQVLVLAQAGDIRAPEVHVLPSLLARVVDKGQVGSRQAEEDGHKASGQVMLHSHGGDEHHPKHQPQDDGQRAQHMVVGFHPSAHHAGQPAEVPRKRDRTIAAVLARQPVHATYAHRLDQQQKHESDGFDGCFTDFGYRGGQYTKSV